MFNFYIHKTTSTPEISINQDKKLMVFIGESFPENASKFYSSIIEWLEKYCSDECTGLVFKCNLIYFNSSTSKILMTIFDIMEDAAQKGNEMVVNWICDSDNDMMIECGEEFREDLEYTKFNIVLSTSDEATL